MGVTWMQIDMYNRFIQVYAIEIFFGIFLFIKIVQYVLALHSFIDCNLGLITFQ